MTVWSIIEVILKTVVACHEPVRMKPHLEMQLPTDPFG
jgi:hypothetical protein